jgi:hypothetical protein
MKKDINVKERLLKPVVELTHINTNVSRDNSEVY